VVVLDGLPQSVQPGFTLFLRGLGFGDNGYQRVDRLVDVVAQGAGRAVDMGQRWRNLFQQAYGTFSGQFRVAFRDLLDFLDGFLDPFYRHGRAPAERIATKTWDELPFVSGHIFPDDMELVVLCHY